MSIKTLVLFGALAGVVFATGCGGGGTAPIAVLPTPAPQTTTLTLNDIPAANANGSEASPGSTPSASATFTITIPRCTPAGPLILVSLKPQWPEIFLNPCNVGADPSNVHVTSSNPGITVALEQNPALLAQGEFFYFVTGSGSGTITFTNAANGASASLTWP